MVVIKSSVPLLEEEDNTRSSTETIQRFKGETNGSCFNPFKHVETQFKQIQSRILKLVEKIDGKFATMAVQAPKS